MAQNGHFSGKSAKIAQKPPFLPKIGHFWPKWPKTAGIPSFRKNGQKRGQKQANFGPKNAKMPKNAKNRQKCPKSVFLGKNAQKMGFLTENPGFSAGTPKKCPRPPQNDILGGGYALRTPQVAPARVARAVTGRTRSRGYALGTPGPVGARNLRAGRRGGSKWPIFRKNGHFCPKLPKIRDFCQKIGFLAKIGDF